MKYVVVGQNRDTGARMSLEFEAESKGAAERKAAQAGMSVRHVNEVVDGPPVAGTPARGGHAATPATGDFRPIRQSSGGLLKLIVVVAILAALAWFFWGRIRGFLPR
jgi:hypothetical protein